MSDFRARRRSATMRARTRSAIISARRWRRRERIGIKCVNAGGVDAFKKNVRAFSLDDVVPEYGLTSREIFQRMQRAVQRDGHSPSAASAHEQSRPSRQCRDGARDDRRLAGPAAASRACAVLRLWQGRQERLLVGGGAIRREDQRQSECHRRRRPGDVRRHRDDLVRRDEAVQQPARRAPEEGRDLRRATAMASAWCPIPIASRTSSTRCNGRRGWSCSCSPNDPMRVFFTTDHPNGAPFTTYPEVFALLMSADKRAQWLSRLPADVLELTNLPVDQARIYALRNRAR